MRLILLKKKKNLNVHFVSKSSHTLLKLRCQVVQDLKHIYLNVEKQTIQDDTELKVVLAAILNHIFPQHKMAFFQFSEL